MAAVAALVLSLAPAAQPATAAASSSHHALVVPSGYPTIQAAVDAAAPGATIKVRAGTYVEQVVIAKRLTIVGAGTRRTIIRAPSTLVSNDADERSIVEVTGGAKVSMSRLTVAGPGSGTCENGALTAGIRVRNEARLDLRFAAVRDIHDTPFAACSHSATGILAGDVPGPTVRLKVDHTEITNYQGGGIIVLGFGSVATITHNVVTGPSKSTGVGTDGIGFPIGAVGTISHNVVSGNNCPPADTTCGPDWFTQFQLAGIGAGGWGPGTVVTDNLLFDNQVGMLLGESDLIRDNRMIDNAFFGLALFDGNIDVRGGLIRGGGGGVWVIADAVDSNVTLRHLRFAHLGGPRIAKVECCGFHATVKIRH